MKYYTFDIVYEKEPEDEGYFAYSPSLPGCFSNGKTLEEVKQNMREAIEQHISTIQSHGEDIPQISNMIHVSELTIGVPE